MLLGRKVITNLDSVSKSRDITLPTKVHIVKAMIFPVVMYGCENWTLKKAGDSGLVTHLSPTLACQAPLLMGFSRQEYWSGFAFTSPRDLPDSGIKPWSPALEADSLLTKPLGKPRRLNDKELMLLNCGAREDSLESLGLQGDQTSQF